MPAYVLLTRLSTAGMRSVVAEPDKLRDVKRTLEEYEASVLADYHLLGKYNHCTIFEVSDNFRAQRAALQLELTSAEDTMLLPAIDLPLFQRMVSQEIRTEGPHEWQVSWWARSIRFCFRWYHFSRHIWKHCKPFTVTGRENFQGLKGPCIVVGNHTSHFDALAIYHGLPQRIKSNIYFGAAADRWFLKDGGGRKELALQPWYNSLIGASFPIRRGGGSATLDYSKWLLSQGASLVIFPEGTRSTSRKMSRFKHGVSLLALEMGVPVVPVYLTGLARLRPKGTNQIFPGPAGAHIQPPIVFEPGTAVPDATKRIYDALNDVHQRVVEHGDVAAPWDWEAPIRREAEPAQRDAA
ncbi:MAG: 1-acyl-sn-glycerol-3-phosphate acyltransferase [Pseudomonadales bacterium]|nr:1-acyl-sn-glycerol-3-phosphate acyltransferase [Pseudomonadales bacterium]